MKKKMTLIAMGLCLILLVGGCKKTEDKTGEEGMSTSELTSYVTLGDYKGLEAALEVDEVTDEDVENEIQTVLKQNMTYEDVTDRAVEEGDTVNIDYVGKLNGEAFEGGSAEGADLEIGSGQFIEGFEDQLIGAKSGETVDLNLTFPDPYDNNPDLAGKKVVFTVTVNSIKKGVLPEFDLDFVKSISSSTSIDAYKAQLKKTLEEESQEEAKTKRENAIWQSALDNAEVKEYPQSELDKTLKEMKDNYSQYLTMTYNMTFEDYLTQTNFTEEEFNEQMQENVKQALKEKMVVYSIGKAENITVTDEELMDEAESLATQYKYESGEKFLETYGEEMLERELMYDKIKTFVLDSAKGDTTKLNSLQ